MKYALPLMFTLLVLALVLAAGANTIASAGEFYLIESRQTYDVSNQPPLILLHGYSPIYKPEFSEQPLRSMQFHLARQLGYADAGVFDGSCNSINQPVYRISYLNSKQKEINAYSNYLKNAINEIKQCHGAEQVDIVAHSMGGIVTRNLIKHNVDHSVRKLIMLGTPNHGNLYNRGKTATQLASTLQLNPDLDLMQLRDQSEFLTGLNKDDETPSTTQYYTVIGNIDGKGDSLVDKSSVPVTGQTDSITVKCYHFALQVPSLCPEAYSFIRQSLM